MPSSDGAGTALLEAHGLRRSFGGLRVLRGLARLRCSGEAVVVAGPNGAGKTTLLRILAGLMRPEAGEVRVLGRPVRGDDSAGRRGIGLVYGGGSLGLMGEVARATVESTLTSQVISPSASA